MNCKPGDLAVIVRAHFPENLGRLVEVLHAYDAIRWECMMLGSAAPAGNLSGVRRMTRYATMRDCNLRPIRWDDSIDSRDVLVPEQVSA
jgi:hypothetical protein